MQSFLSTTTEKAQSLTSMCYLQFCIISTSYKNQIIFEDGLVGIQHGIDRLKCICIGVFSAYFDLYT